MARPHKISLAPIVGLTFLIIVGVSGCKQASTSASTERLNASKSSSEVSPHLKTDPVIARQLMKGEWRLVAIDRRQLNKGGTPTVVFGDEGNCWGSTGVNDFRTTFTLEGEDQNRVKVGPAAVTRKAGPPEAMALETLFLERFESASAFRVDGDVLHLHAGEDQNLTFQRVLH